MSETQAPNSAEQAGLAEAARLLAAGYASQAADKARGLIGANARLGGAHRIFGVALRRLGRHEAAEAELKEALRLDRDDLAAGAALGDLLVDLGRPEEAAAILEPMAGRADADVVVVSTYGAALKATGRLAGAAEAYARAREIAPRSGVAEHNLAGVYGDMHRFAEAEAATVRAFAKGLDAPETWLVRGRALQGLGRFDEAAEAYEQAIRRRGAYPDALGDLAQLIWMRTGDVAAAGAPLDRAVATNPTVMDLRLKKAKLLEFAGDAAGAYAALNANTSEGAGHPGVQVMASHLATRFDPQAAVAHAQRAYAVASNFAAVPSALAEAQLAAGDARAAAATAEAMRRRWPLDQHALALLSTAWRMLGDERYRTLYDYDAFIGTHRLDTPDGWTDLPAYLDELAVALRDLHHLKTHPVGQSLRHGTQTQQSLLHAEAPAIKAFFQAVDGPIRRHIAALGQGADPLRARIAGGYDFAGIWSVRLTPGGFHADHVHQQGWLSSACYIVLPKAVDREPEGWLKFGEPGVVTAPPLGPERFVRPEPGLLALFPSYMWHGTAPFSGDDERLTIAFDLVPAAQ